MNESGVKIQPTPAPFDHVSAVLRQGSLKSALAYVDSLEMLFQEKEPDIRAFVKGATLSFRKLREIMERLYALYPDPHSRPPLFGAPVGIKDIIHVDGFNTRGGSSVPADVIGGPQAGVVQRLIKAGAIILGKTVTVQFANEGPGPTRNPHNLDHTPGGSSSGSAAAVAAGLCPLALGTQTVGSVIRPAAFCGVVGFKPSYGRIPLDGVIPLAPSLDTIGIFSADISGAAAAASVMVADWQGKTALDAPVLGIPTGPYLQKTEPESLGYFHKTCQTLAKAGIKSIQVDFLKDIAEVETANLGLADGEFAAVHAEWFNTYSYLYSPGNRRSILRGQKLSEAMLEQYRAFGASLRDRIDNAFEQHGINAFIAPSATGPAPKGLDSTGNCTMNLPWSHAGMPVLSIPWGRSSNGLPLGLQIIGRYMQDEALLCQSEQITKKRFNLSCMKRQKTE